MAATITNFPVRLVWDHNPADLTADAFAPDGRYLGAYRITLIGCHWCVSYRGPHQGAPIEDCGFATTPDAAKMVADDHSRRLSLG
jgi:hypothetical protein